MCMRVCVCVCVCVCVYKRKVSSLLMIHSPDEAALMCEKIRGSRLWEVECCPPRPRQVHGHLESQNMTLLGNNLFRRNYLR